MTGQSQGAAERSAHVQRGQDAATEGRAVVVQLPSGAWKLRVLVELEEKVARLEGALQRIARGDVPAEYHNTASGYRRYAASVLPHLPPRCEDTAFLARMTAAIEGGGRVTVEDVARLRRLADWADTPPPPAWDGTLDKHEARRAIAAARKRMEGV